MAIVSPLIYVCCLHFSLFFSFPALLHWSLDSFSHAATFPFHCTIFSFQDTITPISDHLYGTLKNCLVLFGIKLSDPVKHLRVLTPTWQGIKVRLLKGV